MEDLIKNAAEADPAPEGGFRRSRSSISISSIRILTEEEVNKVKAKFEEETEFAYEEALRAHVSLSHQFLKLSTQT